MLAAAYREKFGGDHIDDVLGAIEAYKQRIDWRG
jgi:chorismate synthase